MEPPRNDRRRPGVFVTELDAFPPSIVGVETAIPAFIGYTEKANYNGVSVFQKPIRIRSIGDYELIFGGPPEGQIFDFEKAKVADFDFEVTDAEGKTKYYKLKRSSGATPFLLYHSLRLYFANSGGDCFVVSAGDYSDPVTSSQLIEALDAVRDQPGPSSLVVPDAVNLPADKGDTLKSGEFMAVVDAMLTQCGNEKDRIAILDVWGGSGANRSNLDELIENFREGIDSPFLSYGAAYFPFLKTTVVQPSEIASGHFDLKQLRSILEAFAEVKFADDKAKRKEVVALIELLGTEDAPETLDQELLNPLSPLLPQIYAVAAHKIGILPSSGAMAGIYALNDRIRGVWNAPANFSLSSVLAPTLNLDNESQGELNTPLDGKAIDVIREFVGRGTVVWGARTLDGNSNDWRYVQVRRTIIYIEQSIKLALDPFVFAANDGKTWTTVTSMVSNFLQGVWSQGGLMGATADEAFSVECGLGSTMTPQDILEGYMIVQVTLQMIRPAEFIELSFKQRMEG